MNLQKAIQFDRFKAAFEKDPELEAFMDKVTRSMAEFDERGLLENLEHEVGEGNQTQIKFYPEGNPSFIRSVAADKVRIIQAQSRLKENLAEAFQQPELSDMVYAWLSPRLMTTLTLDRAMTTELGKQVAADTPPKTLLLEKGRTTLAHADERIDDALPLLRAEHDAYKASLGSSRMFSYSLAKFGMYFALYVLCGFYSYFRRRASIARCQLTRKAACRRRRLRMPQLVGGTSSIRVSTAVVVRNDRGDRSTVRNSPCC